MYRSKLYTSCPMPSKKEPINVLILNASLKHKKDGVSNTEEVAQQVVKFMKDHGKVASEIIRLSDKNIPVGLKFRMNNSDEWPAIVSKIKKADIIIFATPVWWGQRSSLMQRIIERMDAFDEESSSTGRSALLNKVAGVVITGSEDGAQHVLATILEVLTFMNFTIPPQCCTYWVGEVGMDPKTDRKRRLKSKAVKHMAQNTARNLMYYAQLLKLHPMKPAEKK
ncbi:flavodoxin family protein [soil metagenome]